MHNTLIKIIKYILKINKSFMHILIIIIGLEIKIC